MGKKFLAVIAAVVFVRYCHAQDVMVCTYNIRLDTEQDGGNAWIHRRDFLAGQLQFYSPDIIGLQESLPHQVEFLETRLLGYRAFGEGREGGSKGESTSIFYDTAKYQVDNKKTIWLSPTPDRVSKGWDAAFWRICTYGYFRKKDSGESFWVFNTHLDHKGVVARNNSVQLIMDLIDSVNTTKAPVVLMGDFNSTPESDVILKLKSKMSDSRDISETHPFGEDGTFNGFDFEAVAKDRIDYIFLSKEPELHVKKYAVIRNSKNQKFPSDHFPVFALIYW